MNCWRSSRRASSTRWQASIGWCTTSAASRRRLLSGSRHGRLGRRLGRGGFHGRTAVAALKEEARWRDWQGLCLRVLLAPTPSTTKGGGTLKFWKLQGLGNDYVYLDCFRQPPPRDPAALSRVISDRHFGVGSDGLILICPSEKADVRMRMFNADGSEAEMCGNGVRCVARYAYDHGLTNANP